MDINKRTTSENNGIAFPVVSVDVGFGYSKWAVTLNNEILTGSIPSLAPCYPADDDAHSKDLGLYKRNTVFAEVGENRYVVGPDVSHVASGINRGRNLIDNFPTTPEYKALLLGALYYAGAEDIEVLVLGLPNHTMQQYASTLAKVLHEPATVNGRRISAKKVIVVPQPVGTLYMYGKTATGIQIEGVNRLVVDVGYYTTDWVVSNGYSINGARTGGKVGGISNILASVASQIKAVHGETTSSPEKIDSVLMGSGKDYVPVRSKKIYRDELERYIVKASPVIEGVSKAIRTSVVEIDDIEEIVLSGGGSAIFEPIIRQIFPGIDIKIMPLPAFTNAVGFLLYGQRQLKRAKENEYAAAD
jgi:plasmid segregation protein ParM